VRRFQPVVRDSGMLVVESSDSGLTISGSTAESIGQLAFEHRIVLHELTSERASLEETFLTMTTPKEEVSR
jgi:ABC-2 type transport system ATP-binding protein